MGWGSVGGNEHHFAEGNHMAPVEHLAGKLGGDFIANLPVLCLPRFPSLQRTGKSCSVC